MIRLPKIVENAPDSYPAGPFAESTVRFMRQFFEACKSRPVRTLAQFTLDELVLPYDGGPFEGERFRFETQPFSRLLYEEFDNGGWPETIVTGPSQSGKTLLCFVNVIAYIVAELRKNVVVAVPDLNMADDKWRIDIQPVFLASPRLSQLLPTTGPGSKGGTVKNTITFGNGVVMKFMSPFGDDANRAGFTAPYVVVTEAARFSDPSDTSVEADPLRQLKARQRSISRFDENRQVTLSRRMFVEGTVTLEDELPWKAKVGSSLSRIVCPCPHCGGWVTPEREDLVGWESAKSELEAAQTAFFACPACGEKISDAERKGMNQASKLVHDGQEVVNGEVVGDKPQTMRLFFRWNAFNNLFASPADLAVEEWQASQYAEESEERQLAEKDLCQSLWCIPFVPPRLDFAPLKRDDIAKRREQWPMGIVPEDAKWVTVGVDVGRWRCWYFVTAVRASGQLHCVLYGSLDTSLTRDLQKTPALEGQAIAQCLYEIDELLFGVGLAQEGNASTRRPDVAFVDSNYFTDAVVGWCNAIGQGQAPLERKWVPIIGRGQTAFDGRRFIQPTKLGNEVRKIGKGWYLSYERGRQAWRVTVDSDQSKIQIQDMLRVEQGNPGSLTLPMAPQREHGKVSQHLAAEVRVTVDGKETWKKSGQNHLLDCAAYSLAAAKYLGFEPIRPDERTEKVDGGEVEAGSEAGAGVDAESLPPGRNEAKPNRAKSVTKSGKPKIVKSSWLGA